MANIPIDDNIVMNGDSRYLSDNNGRYMEREYFIGTTAEWNALSSAEKDLYTNKLVILTDV